MHDITFQQLSLAACFIRFYVCNTLHSNEWHTYIPCIYKFVTQTAGRGTSQKYTNIIFMVYNINNIL